MRHFLNDIEIAPKNLQDIGVVSDFTDNPSVLQLNVDKIILPREGYDIVKNHIQTVGVFEGIPYRVEMQSGISLDYYVDLTDEPIYKSYEVEVKIKRRFANDNFFERAKGSSFQMMAKNGVIFPWIYAEYVIVSPNQAELLLTLGITAFSMGQATYQAILQAGQAISDLVNALTPNAGVGITYDVGDLIGLALNAVLAVAYAAAMLTITIDLAQQIMNIIFPSIKYYKACRVIDLMIQGCGYLGYQFQSTLLNSIPNLTILPVPLTKEKESLLDQLFNDLDTATWTLGYPTASDVVPTLGALFTEMENMFNARTKVVNGVVRFERRDYWQNLTPNAIVPALAIQDSRQDGYTYNTEDIWKRYYISYQLDYSDVWCVDFFDPTDAEYSTEPVSVNNPDLVLIKNLQEVKIPFSLGVRKGKLTFVERYVRDFILAPIDGLTGLFGGGTNFVGQINNRKDLLKLSQPLFSNTKILYLTNGRQKESYLDVLHAKNLWKKYHYINQIQLNDYEIRNNIRTRITNADFVNLLNNNYAEIDGVICEILRIEYIDERSWCLITYKFPFDYANGKVSTLVINE